ncbi:MAG: HTH domain-containing protein [Polyangiaceae bacterium]
MRKKARLFALAEHLRARRTGVTAEALAQRFGVTVRTIYRDLDELREAALPLHADRGPGGGYALDRSYTLPPVNFTAREAALLVVVGRWATEMRLVPFTDTMESALDKVRGALSTQAQRELARHVENLLFVGIPALAPPPEVRAIVERAWFEDRPMRVAYRHGDGTASSRVVRITRLLAERTMTILECEELGADARATRRLRLDRIEKAALEDVTAAAEAAVHPSAHPSVHPTGPAGRGASAARRSASAARR